MGTTDYSVASSGFILLLARRCRLEFENREGGRTVGSGRVATIIE